MKSQEFDFREYRVYRMTSPEPWSENCYLVKHISSGAGVLFDPGDLAASIDEIIQTSDTDLLHIMLTHGHHDHVGALLELCQRYRITARLHQADRRLYRHAPLYAMRFSQKTINIPENVDTFNSLDAGLTHFELGHTTFRAFHTPGHTPGSVCFLFDEFLFSGDILFCQKIGRTDLPGGNAEQITESISALFEVICDGMLFFPGHGREWPVEAARSWWRSRS